MVTIRNEHVEAQFTPWRAELVALRGRHGREFLWDGNPAVWKGHSPILFPIVGMVPNDTATISGTNYPLRQHGFAPLFDFTLVDSSPEACTFRLEANVETRRSYPFEFKLDIRYALDAATLSMTATVSNNSETDMPYSFGFHPGFRWPLPDAGPRAGHSLEFEKDENAPIRRPQDGLLDPRRFENPIEGRRLTLRDDLFEQGAIMFDEIASRQVRFGSDHGPSLNVEWKNLPHLGIWTKPGAHYLCIEPWQGLPAPLNFEGELSEKPGILMLKPGQTNEFKMLITVVE